MPGWILERELTNGTTVFDIGYRVNGRTVRRKGGTTRDEAQSALTIAVAEVETGTIHPGVHTTDTLRTYASRAGSCAGNPSSSRARSRPTATTSPTGSSRHSAMCGCATTERIEDAILDMQKLKPRRGPAQSHLQLKDDQQHPDDAGSHCRHRRQRRASAGKPVSPPRRRRHPAPARSGRVSGDALPAARGDPWLPGRVRSRGLYGSGRGDGAGWAAHLRGDSVGAAGHRYQDRDDPRRPPDPDRHTIPPEGTRHREPSKSARDSPRSWRVASPGATRRGMEICLPDPDDGDYIDRTRIRSRWHIPALLDAGLDPRLRVHDLRHSAAAAWLIAGGQSLEYVRRQLGHASILETQKYAHLERAGRSQAADITEAGIWTQEVAVG